MLSGIQTVNGLQRPGIGHPSADNFRFMDMAQGHVVKSRRHQLFFLHRHMLFIAAMGQQNMISRLIHRGDPVIERRFDFPVFIAEPVDPCVQRLQMTYVQGLAVEKMYIFRPGESPVIGAFADKIVVPGHHDDLGRSRTRQTVIQFL